MRTSVPAVPTESPFDALRRTLPEGSEYWDGRELMPHLGYSKWENFRPAIADAQGVIAAEQGDTASEQAFSWQQEKGTGGASRENCRLSRGACYVTAMRGDSRKPEIRAALIYFAVKTREAETGMLSLPELMAQIEELRQAATLPDGPSAARVDLVREHLRMRDWWQTAKQAQAVAEQRVAYLEWAMQRERDRFRETLDAIPSLMDHPDRAELERLTERAALRALIKEQKAHFATKARLRELTPPQEEPRPQISPPRACRSGDMPAWSFGAWLDTMTLEPGRIGDLARDYAAPPDCCRAHASVSSLRRHMKDAHDAGSLALNALKAAEFRFRQEWPTGDQ